MKKILIIGAGQGGTRVLGEINRAHGDLKVVGFLDDNEKLLNKYVNGIKVIGDTSQISQIVREFHVDEIIIAIPSMRGNKLAKLAEKIKIANISFKVLPSIFEALKAPKDAKLATGKIREIDLSDLLNREPIKIDLNQISGYLKNKRVLITGAGGSIGSEIARQVANVGPASLVILDIYENNLYELEQELNFKTQTLVTDIKDKENLKDLFEKYRPEIVFHAAAHKHVPLMEEVPREAIKNNILGSHNLIDLAIKYQVERFVFISTDKAINPTSIMGASKRFSEYEILCTDSKTIFAIVRFGNVLGSYGSVIPLWEKQLKASRPITVTHKNMRRFFMTIPEAVSLVIQAGAIANDKEIFYLKMGKQYRILNLAHDFCKLSGYTPGEDAKIIFSGTRPGEKLYEVIKEEGENSRITRHSKIVQIIPKRVEVEKLKNLLSLFETRIDILTKEDIINNLKQLMPSFAHYTYLEKPKKNNHIVQFSPPSINQDEIRAVTKVLKSRWLTTGDEAKKFEEEFANKFGYTKSLAMSSATAGLHLALVALGIGKGDEVILPSYTFASCANTVEWVGAKPVFVDIKEGCLIDPVKIEAAISRKTKAILVVHFAGQMADMDEIINIAKKNNLKIIEDCAHALGAAYKGKNAGSIGDVGVFSFYATKNITSGEGGMVVAKDREILKKIELLRLHGMSAGAFDRYSERGKWYYEITQAGFKYNLTDISASIGRVQLRKFDKFQKKREEIANYYLENFKNVSGIRLPSILSGRVHAWHIFYIQVDPQKRDELINSLRLFNIIVGVHFIPLHFQPYYREKYNLKEGDLPETESMFKGEISLPIYPDLTKKDQDYIIEVLKYLLSIK